MPHAVTRTSTPSSGQVASATVPTDIVPGPVPDRRSHRILPSSHIEALRPVSYRVVLQLGGAGDRVHLHAHAGRPHAHRRSGGLRARSRGAACATSAARTWACPAPSLQALMDDIRGKRPHHPPRGRVRDARGHAAVGAGRRRDRPRLPDRRHADRAGAGDHRRHRASSSSPTSARSSTTRACCGARSPRSPTTPAAPRASASTASTCSPTATTATSTRWSRRSSARPRCP